MDGGSSLPRPRVGRLWTVYATAVYTIPWGIALGVLGIRRLQRFSWWAAVITMLVAFSLNMLITTTFVR